MPSHKGFTVRIQSEDGKDYEEHAVKRAGNSSTCYVESRAGETYQVWFECAKPPKDEQVYDGSLYVDGKEFGGAFVDVAVPAVTISTTIDFARGLQRTFKFGTLRTTDDDDFLVDDPASLEHVGEIKLEIWLSKVENDHESDGKSYGETVGVLHEKSKKASLSHTTELGEATVHDNANNVSVLRSMLATFKFLYRSRLLLDIEGHLAHSGPVIDPWAIPPSLQNRKHRKKARKLEAKLEAEQDGEDKKLVNKRIKTEQTQRLKPEQPPPPLNPNANHITNAAEARRQLKTER